MIAAAWLCTYGNYDKQLQSLIWQCLDIGLMTFNCWCNKLKAVTFFSDVNKTNSIHLQCIVIIVENGNLKHLILKK